MTAYKVPTWIYYLAVRRPVNTTRVSKLHKLYARYILYYIKTVKKVSS